MGAGRILSQLMVPCANIPKVDLYREIEALYMLHYMFGLRS